MAILIGPMTKPQTAAGAIAEAFAGQVVLNARHVGLTALQLPDDPGVEAWRWELMSGAPDVRDQGATRFVMTDQGRVKFPTGKDAHPLVEKGVVLFIEDVGSWLVVAEDDQGGEDLELAMLGLEHMDACLAGDVPASWGAK